MAKMSKDKLHEKVNSVYRLVLIAAGRARQLGRGSRPLVKTDAKKASTIALEEILAGKVRYEEESEKD